MKPVAPKPRKQPVVKGQEEQTESEYSEEEQEEEEIGGACTQYICIQMFQS